MKVQTHLTFEDYVARGDANTAGLLKGDHPLMPLVKAYYRFFAGQLWSDGPPQADVPMFLGINAFTLWTGGVRIALTGREAATYPLLRTALESACYALVIARRPHLATVWSARHDGQAQRKACRKAFSAAVGEAADLAEAIYPSSGEFIVDLYDATIDMGAHPNTRAVMSHVHTEPGASDEVRLGVGSIYPGNSLPVARALLRVIETGRGLSMALTAALPVLPPAVAAGVQALETQLEALFPSGVTCPT